MRPRAWANTFLHDGWRLHMTPSIHQAQAVPFDIPEGLERTNFDAAGRAIVAAELALQTWESEGGATGREFPAAIVETNSLLTAPPGHATGSDVFAC